MLRKRKITRQQYKETNDEENEDDERKFNIMEQVKSERFDELKGTHLLELNGHELSLKLIQRNGFEKPILVEKQDGLGLLVPPKSFIVRDVRNYVGHQRIIDVMDVKTQKNIEMSMKDWCKYYESKHRDKLLNVISLEFSHTKLDELVEAPLIVRLLDWVDLVWPKFLKQSQIESTNSITSMKYPKVQKYCLMSVKGSYTDFHIDFGGTSVWYHILRGRKIFWMVPPTELNLQIFEEWTLSGQQQDVFFGDTVEECFRVELCAGNTFFIPSGWIHAVYTLEDSLVFGGNFLHSFGIENQLKVSKIEDATKVPHKFRYPFYTEILWYVVQHYVYCLTDKDHLHRHELEAMAAREKELTEAALLTKNNNKLDSIEIEDETTESEHDDSDNNSNNKKKKPTATSKSKKPSKFKSKGKNQKKKKKQATPSSTDDDDTDIDSANEALYDDKQSSKPINTCRMTKNSLLRLQYEVDQNELEEESKTSPSKSNTSKSPVKEKTTASSETEFSKSLTSGANSAQKKQQLVSTTINLAEIMLSENESKMNGWSTTAGGVGQAIWSNPSAESKEPIKIHITKIEVNGLKVLVKHLSKLSGAKKNLPSLIRNSRALLDDCRKLIVEHENDDPELAITGKPITPELLRKPKTTDMNELIGQFFKPSNDTTGNNDDDEVDPHNNSAYAKHTMSSSPSKVKIEQNPPFNKLKNSSYSSEQSSIVKNEDQKATSNSSSSNDNVTGVSSSSKLTPHKETKCLSPNKKFSSPTSSSANESNSTPRPKSPPTRPLSNNQYASKTSKKFSVNLDLPGSFKDLIAATSLAKEAFDVKGSDVTSSLYGTTKDLVSPKSHIKQTKKNNRPTSDSLKSPLDILNAPPLATTTVGSCGSGAGAGNHNKDALPSPSFPGMSEAAKSNPQIHKRVINPHTVRLQQQNKEKLIYASAPYISPVSESHIKQPNKTNDTTSDSTRLSLDNLNTPTLPTPTITTSSYANNSAGSNPGSIHTKDPLHSPNFSGVNDSSKPSSHIQNRVINSGRQQQQNTDKLTFSSAPYAPPASAQMVRPQQISSTQSGTTKTSATPVITTSAPIQVKSAIQPSPSTTLTYNSAQVIKGPTTFGTSSKETIQQNNIATVKAGDKTLPQRPISPVQTASEKHKTKKLKKTKDPSSSSSSSTSKSTSTSTSITSTSTPTTTSIPQLTQQQHLIQTIVPNLQSQVHPTQSVICGIVRPPTTSQSTSGLAMSQATMAPRIGQQQYMITRPLLFNTMPAFSAAQYQQLPRAQMPLFTAPMGAQFGLPLQQGARIVWATQPRSLQPSTTPLVATTTSVPVQVKTMSQPALTTPTIQGSGQIIKAIPASSSSITKQGQQTANVALMKIDNKALSRQSGAALQTETDKHKIKKVKKSKESSSSTSTPQVTQHQHLIQTIVPNLQSQVHPTQSVICGIVRPPTTSQSTSGLAMSQATMAPRIGQQQYMITRPLLFNTMPAFSAAQYQQLPRAQMPLFTAPMGAQFGLPLQQGARIVWATQPRSLQPSTTPLVTTATSVPVQVKTVPQSALATAPICNPAAAVKALATPSRSKESHQQDNAALLSLATTALSIAPVVNGQDTVAQKCGR